jgi:hypothetical protein
MGLVKGREKDNPVKSQCSLIITFTTKSPVMPDLIRHPGLLVIQDVSEFRLSPE